MTPPDLRLTCLGRDVLRRYRAAPRAAQLYLNLRWRWTPYEQVAQRLPREGTILDLGCGHGLLSLALALGEPGRTIRGIDHDPARVLAAQTAAAGIDNLRFAAGNLLQAVIDQAADAAVAGIVVLDAIHYLGYEQQELFLRQARASLQPGGMLLIRDVDAAAGKSFVVNRWHERAMTSLGFTCADRLNFRTRDDWLGTLASAGFLPASEPCSRFPFADWLFVCQPSTSKGARAA